MRPACDSDNVGVPVMESSQRCGRNRLTHIKVPVEPMNIRRDAGSRANHALNPFINTRVLQNKIRIKARYWDQVNSDPDTTRVSVGPGCADVGPGGLNAFICNYLMTLPSIFSSLQIASRASPNIDRLRRTMFYLDANHAAEKLTAQVIIIHIAQVFNDEKMRQTGEQRNPT